jgi:hypothetical protein
MSYQASLILLELQAHCDHNFLYEGEARPASIPSCGRYSRRELQKGKLCGCSKGRDRGERRRHRSGYGWAGAFHAQRGCFSDGRPHDHSLHNQRFVLLFRDIDTIYSRD